MTGIGSNGPWGWGGIMPDEARVWNRTGATIPAGGILAHDFGESQTETENNIVGAKASGFANCRGHGNNYGIKQGVAPVAIEAIADNKAGLVRYVGIFQMLVGTSNAVTLAAADPNHLLYYRSGATFLDIVPATVAGTRAPGILLEAVSGLATGVPTTAWVMFDAIEPWFEYYVD